MNLLDAVIILFIAIFAWKGFRNGLVKEVFRIVGLVLAVFVAFQYANFAGSIIGALFNIQDFYLPYIGFALLFIAAQIAVHVSIVFLDKLIQLLLLSIPNRLFGSLFGVLKSSLIVSIMLIFAAGFGFSGSDIQKESLFYKPMLKVAPASYDIVARVLPGVKPYRDSVERYLSVPEASNK
ncbi:MAG: CvpA family protein [Balneolaceae bacterium]|nr:MAG: CvpA family protein [Balneolaceae bacterium]